MVFSLISRSLRIRMGCSVYAVNVTQNFSSQSCLSKNDTFKFSDLEVKLKDASQKEAKPNIQDVKFGHSFSDHMLEIEWSDEKGWSRPLISPLHNFSLHPASKVFHYAQELFEGLKAFRSKSGKVLLFRPELNVERLLNTAERTALPKFDKEEFLKCLKKLVSIDKDWVPSSDGSSLYIRPTFIGVEPSLGVAASKTALLYVITGPVGSYFPTGKEQPVSLYAATHAVRSWPGGVGDKKMGCNYGPTIQVQQLAEKQNFQQILWLFGEDHQLVEVGTMNIFVHLMNSSGVQELVTPPLDGLILPGIVRRSLLELAQTWNEFKVSERKITMQEVIQARNENRYGVTASPWSVPVD
ncbi:branched-chain-amino-acid aminotransferase, mitochondrial-like isoform X2 [Uloborus diversus]|uniref:branched-chain-amino-acid aminotransferase, mitochondrial-like isoform X2 n=1 Tax=Uloborus diversus TaxID=327109 RepID=UPI0024091416|nr:branched-chain-amino-acid aminotransferase, mitochondrial-like isoform X2 [Uloborus diversus]